MNAGCYFGYLNQAHYVNGVAAGLSTKTNKIGFVAAKPIPLGALQHQSVLLGARKVNPNATVQVIFTGEWSLPVREAEATNALVDAGCDVITCHVDSPKVVIETAERPRRQDLRPQCRPGAAGAQGLHHRRRVQVGDDLQEPTPTTLAKGETLPNFIVGGYDKDMVQNTAFGAGASDEAQGRRDRRHRRAQGQQADLRRPAEGQQRQGGHPGRQEHRQLRRLPRTDELPRRRRRRLDH